MAELVEWLFLLGRVVFGGFFVYNGLQHVLERDRMIPYARSKGVPAPELLIPGTGVLALLGGLGVIAGVFPHASLGLLLLFLAPVTVLMHNFWTVDDAEKRHIERSRFARNAALIGACLAFFVINVPWDFALL